ncbi:ABC transporter substrate-binding protein [Nocardioides sp.]|uniref:ABC transporter substrate-binding protein n=1 Tax=Nocardioides sp. TaxID=35761 RepID=UPI002B279F4A|nr:ABC transporter substrate-binding protein [Nocardioides sp.]
MTLIGRALVVAAIMLGAGIVAPSVSTRPVAAAVAAVDVESARQDPACSLGTGPGVTDRAVTLGNVADVSGPLPGLHRSARQAVVAYVAYFNASGATLCGRRLELESYDSRMSVEADERVYARACRNTFAVVGSSSELDSGGARRTQRCGLPDLRAVVSTAARARCGTCFATHANSTVHVAASVPDALVRRHPKASQKAGIFYVDIGGARERVTTQATAWKRRGMRVPVVQSIDVDERDYSPYVELMAEQRTRIAYFDGPARNAARLARALQSADFRPDVFLVSAASYSPDYLQRAGDAAEGTQVVVDFTAFEEESDSSELVAYRSWLEKTSPGAAPTAEGVYAWSAARLFSEVAHSLGGRLTRERLVRALERVDDWTGRGLHAPQPVGDRTTGACSRFLELDQGVWVPVVRASYRCGRVLRVS